MLNRVINTFVYNIVLIIITVSCLASDIEFEQLDGDFWSGKAGPRAETMPVLVKKVEEQLNISSDSDHRAKGIVGEAASRALFVVNGYVPLEEYFPQRFRASFGVPNNGFSADSCSGKTSRSDHGIDGIFIRIDGDRINHIIINESKYRGRQNLHLDDFGVTAKGVRQMHTNWVNAHLGQIGCFDFANITRHRTATLASSDGVLKLYRIKNKGGNYSQGVDVLSLITRIPTSGDLAKQLGAFLQSI
jgi:hypothetical protein